MLQDSDDEYAYDEDDVDDGDETKFDDDDEPDASTSPQNLCHVFRSVGSVVVPPLLLDGDAGADRVLPHDQVLFRR